MKYFDIYDAIIAIKTKKEAKDFLLDLCTPAETLAITERWKVCQFLYNGDLSYRKIKDKTGASLTTISRVARFLKMEKNDGYKKILEKLFS